MSDNNLRPSLPATLKKIAAEKWHEIIAEYWPDRIKASDLPMLEIYCANYQRWVEAEETLAQESHVLSASNGNLYPNPYIGISNKSMQIITKLSKELGLTTIHKGKSKGTPVKTAAFAPRSRN